MKRGIFLLMPVLFLVVVLGCDKLRLAPAKKGADVKRAMPAVKVEGTVIAQVNNIPLTLEDLDQEVNSYNALVPADKPELKITTREQKINYLKNEMVRRTLLYQDALDRGLDRNKDVISALEKTKMDLLVVELVRQEADKVDVTSKEIEDYYNTYKEQLKEPEERRVREIVLPSEQESRDVLIEVLQGGDFGQLAKQRSKSPSAKEGGDLGYIPRGSKFVQFDAVAFSDTMEKGKVSNIFKGPEGYYIIKVEEIRGGKQKSLSEMWDDIKRGLTFLKQQEKIEQLIGKLSRDARIEVYEGKIK